MRATSIKKTSKSTTPKAKYDENLEGAVVLYRAVGAHDEQYVIITATIQKLELTNRV